MARKVRHDERQIPEFFLDISWALIVARIDKLTGFLFQLGQNRPNIGPVEPHPSRAVLKLDRAGECGQVQRHTIEDRGRPVSLPLSRLGRFPVAGLLLGRFEIGLNAEHMGMTAYHLVANPFDNIRKIKKRSLRRHLRVIDHLQQQITKFAPKLAVCRALNRVRDLIGLFYGIRRNGLKILLNIPRAPAVLVA